ncbi:MAG: excinuclease ABC subunit B [Spirochaetales bacterium]|nr:excinuclease ABC subunit B [Spirochaetales bacterium]
MARFTVHAGFQPAGDQGKAIAGLSKGFKEGKKHLVLKGVTGSGKTFTMAKLIEELQLPTLIISHNKTLAAQLYREFLDFFPENAVEYFVSYYDYYQPEAYVPSRDLYIEKDSSINDEIDRMRLATTEALMERRDVIVVATVSCIYGLGSPEFFQEMRLSLARGDSVPIGRLTSKLITLQYERNDAVLERGKFRVKGGVLEIQPAYMKDAFRIEFGFDEVERIRRINPLTGDTLEEGDSLTLYPAKHFIMPQEQVKAALLRIREELDQTLARFEGEGKLVEAQRLKGRTEYDLEMLEEMGYCPGIENYSRPLSNRAEGQRPAVLIDYFPDDFLTIIDESHVTLPQIGGMYNGDRARKQNLVNYGFRLPSALDNRPLYFGEFEALMPRALYVSATPGPGEMEKAEGVVEQLIRPTGLLDPLLSVRPTEGQIEDLYKEIQGRIAQGERVLITTLTKRMAEELANFYLAMGLSVQYLHSEVETIERVEILKNLRAGKIDVLIGINLLREGLDLPEVSLIAILDADKIGFLRSATSLIQTIGRAARNVNGLVILYADRMSAAMEEAIDETNRRRSLQEAHNRAMGITPVTIKKAVADILVRQKEEKQKAEGVTLEVLKNSYNVLIPREKKQLIKALEEEMLSLAKDMEYERAAVVRDEILKLQGKL